MGAVRLCAESGFGDQRIWRGLDASACSQRGSRVWTKAYPSGFPEVRRISKTDPRRAYAVPQNPQHGAHVPDWFPEGRKDLVTVVCHCSSGLLDCCSTPP